MKLSPTGKHLWSFHLKDSSAPSVSTNKHEMCTKILIDSNDDIVCVGDSHSGGSDSDIFFLKVSKAGALEWIEQFGATNIPVAGGSTSGDETLANAAIDANNSLYLCGYTTGNLAETNGGERDMFWAKISLQNQSVNWFKQFGSASSGSNYNVSNNDHCSAIVTNSNGSNIYIAGSTYSNLAQANGGSSDIIIGSISPNNGTLKWIKHWGSNSPAPIKNTSGK